jgi:hypothetical protein
MELRYSLDPNDLAGGRGRRRVQECRILSEFDLLEYLALAEGL